MKTRFDTIIWSNRWLKKKHRRNGDWTIVGIRKYHFSPTEFEYQLCFFGFDARIWFKKVAVKKGVVLIKTK